MKARPSFAPLFMALVLVLAVPGLAAQSQSGLSSGATISLVTMWPGAEIYSAFGHSAFRVRDPATGLDLLFNYGTFDFKDPLFIPRFVRGELNYALSVYPYKAYYDFNRESEHRRWDEQVFDLDRAEVEAVYRFLVWNARAENRYYRYDFIKDNCATRIDDALAKALGSVYTLGQAPVTRRGATYRDLIDENVAGRPLYRFLFSFVLGRASDQVVTTREASFLPLYLAKALDSATIASGGSPRKLVRSTARIYEPPSFSDFSTPWLDPGLVLWPLALLVLLLSGSSGRALLKGAPLRRRFAWADLALFLVLGLVGLITAYLDFFSVHSATKGNLNLLWLWPTHLIAAFFAPSRGLSRWKAAYFALAALLAIAPLLAWPLWPQGMDTRLIPLLLILASRSACLALEASPLARAGTARGQKRRRSR